MEAAKTLKLGLERAPADARLKASLAPLAMSLGDFAFKIRNYEEAAKRYSEAISFVPTDHEPLCKRLRCCNHLGRYNQVLEDAGACLALRPDFVDGYQAKSQAEFGLEKFDEAARLPLKED